MIDTHAHLTSRLCDIERVEQGGLFDKLDGVILSASTPEDSKDNIELSLKFKDKLFPAVGIHPQESKFSGTINDQINLLEDLVKNYKQIVAIGECGLDFSPPLPGYEERSAKDQDILFRKQMELAAKYDLPVIVHSRKAMDETIEVLKDYKNIRGVIHCYTGGKKRIQKILDLGEWYFGMDGNLTYEEGLVEVVKNIPKDRILAETDTPFLTPIPHRGETNKPDYVEFVYKKIAVIWGMELKEAEKIIDENAVRLFKIKI